MKKLLSVAVTVFMIISFMCCYELTSAASAADVTLDSASFMSGGSEIYVIGTGSISAKIKVVSETAKPAMFISAVFNGNAVEAVDFQSVSLTVGKNTLSGDALPVSNAEGRIIKVMLWDNSYSPLIDAVYLSDVSCEKKITSFSVPNATAVDINTEDRIITVEYGAAYVQSGNYTYPSLSGVTPTISFAGASVYPASGDAVDLSLRGYRTYTVTAADGSTTDYKVIAENTVIEAVAGFSGTLNNSTTDKTSHSPKAPYSGFACLQENQL
jgi:hypothetical protein